MSWKQRLQEQGLSLPAVAKPVAAYIPAIAQGNLIYTSSQLPLAEGKLQCTGKLPGTSPEQAKEAAALCFRNALAAANAIAEEQGKEILSVLKLTGFVASEAGFTAQPGVVNGASELALALFGEQGKHARSAVGVASLPLDASVEIEAIFVMG